MKTCIEVEKLTKKFNGRTVVDELSFTVRRQEVFGLLGHNGAGKTSTIESILGLKKADGGNVRILGMNPAARRKELFEKIGVQLQSSHYQANIRVGEICEEFSALYKKPADYRRLLAQFRMEKLENQPVEKLSGGEKQKLSVVLALLPDPEIVFLDELTTGLDTAARHEVWQTLGHLKEQGLTIFLTTHYMEEAQTLCDRILLLREGRAVASGSVEEVVKGSPYETLEEAYLWYMGEETAE